MQRASIRSAQLLRDEELDANSDYAVVMDVVGMCARLSLTLPKVLAMPCREGHRLLLCRVRS
eukprot:1239604-Rhodomonas_salina.1